MTGARSVKKIEINGSPQLQLCFIGAVVTRDERDHRMQAV